VLDTTAWIWTCVAASIFLFLTWCFALGIWRGRNQVAAGKTWARTKGEIVASEVVAEGSHTDDDDTDCTAVVRYRYAVDGKTYDSDRIAFGERGHTMRMLASQVVAKYPVGAQVDVFYNPKRPSSAVLEAKSGAPAAFTVAVIVFGTVSAVLVAHAVAGKVVYVSDGFPLWVFLVPAAALAVAGVCICGFVDLVRKENTSARWPTTPGTVTASAVVEHVSRDKDDNIEIRFVPQVRYSYRVGGREFHCDTQKWGWSELYVSREGPEKILARYPKGGSVPVFYDPADPSKAVLEPGNRRGTFAPLAAVMVFGLPAVLFYWMYFAGAGTPL